MKTINLDLFDLVIEKCKNLKGYTAIGITGDEAGANLYNFETKEEFERVFKLNKHHISVIPGTIESNEIWCDDGYYLMIDGKLQNI